MEQQIKKVADTEEIVSDSENNSAKEKNEEELKALYPIKGDKIELTKIVSVESLQDTILEIENKDEITDDNTIMYEIDNDLLNSKNQKDYIINIKTGQVYKWKAFSYTSKKYHRPDCGIRKDKEPDDDTPTVEKDEDEVVKDRLTVTPSNMKLNVDETQSFTVKFDDNDVELSHIQWRQTGVGENEIDKYIDDLSEYETTNDEEDEEADEIELSITDENDYEDDIINIKNGIVTGLVKGQTRVVITYKKDNVKYRTYLDVEVVDPEPEEEITSAASIQLNPLTVNRGKKKTIQTTKINGKKIRNTKFTWESKDETIATVNKYGIVTGVSGIDEGKKVTIVGTLKKDETIKVECEVTVLELTHFTPTIELRSYKKLFVKNDIDKKYGMTYFTYILDDTTVKKSRYKSKTVKNPVDEYTTYKVKVIASNGKYKVTSDEVTLSTPQLYFPITYDANGGTGAPDTQNKFRDKSIKLSTTKPSKSDYTFAGWSGSDGNSYAAGATYTENANLNLTATWNYTPITNTTNYPLLTSKGVLAPSSYASNALTKKTFDGDTSTNIYWNNGTKKMCVHSSAYGKTLHVVCTARTKSGSSCSFYSLDTSGNKTVIESKKGSGDYKNTPYDLTFTIPDNTEYYCFSASSIYAGWWVKDFSVY